MQFNPKNIPIPEAHIIGILLGSFIHLFFKVNIFSPAWIGHLTGWPLILLGAGIALWAVFEAGEMNISSPEKLVTSGPYAYSRNPMYVSWLLIFMGFAFVLNSIWLAVFFPCVVAYVHFVEIPKEERALEQRFGARYRDYRERVRRYL